MFELVFERLVGVGCGEWRGDIYGWKSSVYRGIRYGKEGFWGVVGGCFG